MELEKKLAVYAFGGTKYLADAIGISRNAIYQWPKMIPEPRASHIRDLARRYDIKIPKKLPKFAPDV